MAKSKITAFVTRKAKRSRPRTGPTFIQRSRNESSEQKAIWHQVTGVGKAHVRRPFFGLTDQEQETGRASLEQLIAQRLRGLSA